MTEVQHAPQGGAILNIGGDIGALLLHVPAQHLEQEIHVAPIENPTHRTHTVVREHPLPGGRTTIAALFPELPAGKYQIIGHGSPLITVRGGHVTTQYLTS